MCDNRSSVDAMILIDRSNIERKSYYNKVGYKGYASRIRNIKSIDVNDPAYQSKYPLVNKQVNANLNNLELYKYQKRLYQRLYKRRERKNKSERLVNLPRAIRNETDSEDEIGSYCSPSLILG